MMPMTHKDSWVSKHKKIVALLIVLLIYGSLFAVNLGYALGGGKALWGAVPWGIIHVQALSLVNSTVPGLDTRVFAKAVNSTQTGILAKYGGREQPGDFPSKLRSVYYSSGNGDPSSVQYRTAITDSVGGIGDYLATMSPNAMVPYLWDNYKSQMIAKGYATYNALYAAVTSDSEVAATLSENYDWGWWETCGPSSGASCPVGSTVFAMPAAAYWTPTMLSYAMGGSASDSYLNCVDEGYTPTTCLDAIGKAYASGSFTNGAIAKGDVDTRIYGDKPFVLSASDPKWFITASKNLQDQQCDALGLARASCEVTPSSIVEATANVPSNNPDYLLPFWQAERASPGGTGQMKGGDTTYFVVPEDVLLSKEFLGSDASSCAATDKQCFLNVATVKMQKIQGVLEGLAMGAPVQAAVPGEVAGGCGDPHSASAGLCIDPTLYAYVVTTALPALQAGLTAWTTAHGLSLLWRGTAIEESMPWLASEALPSPTEAVLDAIVLGHEQLPSVDQVTGKNVAAPITSLYATELYWYVKNYGFLLTSGQSPFLIAGKQYGCGNLPPGSGACYTTALGDGDVSLDDYYNFLLTQTSALSQAYGTTITATDVTAAFTTAKTLAQPKYDPAVTGWFLYDRLSYFADLCSHTYCEFPGTEHVESWEIGNDRPWAATCSPQPSCGNTLPPNYDPQWDAWRVAHGYGATGAAFQAQLNDIKTMSYDQFAAKYGTLDSNGFWKAGTDQSYYGESPFGEVVQLMAKQPGSWTIFQQSVNACLGTGKICTINVNTVTGTITVTPVSCKPGDATCQGKGGTPPDPKDKTPPSSSTPETTPGGVPIAQDSAYSNAAGTGPTGCNRPGQRCVLSFVDPLSLLGIQQLMSKPPAFSWFRPGDWIIPGDSVVINPLTIYMPGLIINGYWILGLIIILALWLIAAIVSALRRKRR